MKSVVLAQTGVGASRWLLIDSHVTPVSVGIGVVVTGTVTYNVEYTYDDFLDPTVTVTAWSPGQLPAALHGATANQDGVITWPIRGVRVNVTAGSGTAAMTVIQSGIKQ
jgi:hypothetical protein